MWQRFATRPAAGALLAVLQQYVETCVIALGRTELGLWSVTCFPKGGFRVNASWQEVFHTGDGQDFFLLVAPTVLARVYGPGWIWYLNSLGTEVEEQPYRFPGYDNAALYVQGAENASALLRMPGVQAAARALSLNCMRKAPTPHSRSHAPQMVDFLGAGAPT